jgi:hypothetical protein
MCSVLGSELQFIMQINASSQPIIPGSCWLTLANLAFPLFQPNTFRFSWITWAENFSSANLQLISDLSITLHGVSWTAYSKTPGGHRSFLDSSGYGYEELFSLDFIFFPWGIESSEFLGVRNHWWTESCLLLLRVPRVRPTGLHKRRKWKRWRLSRFSSEYWGQSKRWEGSSPWTTGRHLGKLEAQLHSLLTSTLDIYKGFISKPPYPEYEDPYTMNWGLRGPKDGLNAVYGGQIPCFCRETNQLQAKSLYEIHIPCPLNTEGRDQNLIRFVHTKVPSVEGFSSSHQVRFVFHWYVDFKKEMKPWEKNILW